jgi:H+/Cl- antiporter ClcA
MRRSPERRTTCHRCYAVIAKGRVCPWCGHDPADDDHVEEARHRHHGALRHRRARRTRAGRATNPAVLHSCPYCAAVVPVGLCDWCGFNAGDEVAVDALQRYRESERLRRATRRAELRQRIAPPSRRAPAETDATTSSPRQFMTCPACHQWSSYGVCDWCDFDATDADAVAHLAHEHRFSRARWRARREHAYSVLRGLIRFDLGEHGRLILHLLKWIVLGTLVGLIAGAAGAAFLETLTWATDLRAAHPWLLALLPLGGLAVGLAYHYGGGRADEGNNLIIDEIHEPRGWVPKRMAPLVFVGTIVTQLFGGSAGREGTSIQMSGSLTDWASRILRLDSEDRRMMLIAAIAGGFGAVFGVPLAGAVFALEVQSVGRVKYEALVPCLTASIVGDLVVRGLGVRHTPTPQLGEVSLQAGLLGKVALAGLAFGLASVLFIELTHGFKRAFRSLIPWAPARPFAGGFVIIAMTLLVGSQTYNGLSLGLIGEALSGGDVPTWAFLLKILFTAVTLGALFQGGEVTPLFVIGATLGATLAGVLGVPVTLLAALGFVAVFAGATNTPLACTIMGAELFGSGAVVYFATACVISFVFSSHRGIYGTQRVPEPETAGSGADTMVALHEVSRRRRHWLPARQTGT